MTIEFNTNIPAPVSKKGKKGKWKTLLEEMAPHANAWIAVAPKDRASLSRSANLYMKGRYSLVKADQDWLQENGHEDGTYILIIK
tara:strand:- start:77 stop:331 length:255 start_codon:yes stop_codon:yes gene_type:complete